MGKSAILPKTWIKKHSENNSRWVWPLRRMAPEAVWKVWHEKRLETVRRKRGSWRGSTGKCLGLGKPRGRNAVLGSQGQQRWKWGVFSISLCTELKHRPSRGLWQIATRWHCFLIRQVGLANQEAPCHKSKSAALALAWAAALPLAEPRPGRTAPESGGLLTCETKRSWAGWFLQLRQLPLNVFSMF